MVGAAVVRALAEAGRDVIGFYHTRSDRIEKLALEFGSCVKPWRYDLVTGDQHFPEDIEIDEIIHCAVTNLEKNHAPSRNIEMARTVALISRTF